VGRPDRVGNVRPVTTSPPIAHRGPWLRYRAETSGGRRASWLELLFDLVFVVAVAELAGRLHDDPTGSGALAFAGLAVPVVWAWMNVTFYADQFDTDDVPFRLAVFAAMLAVLVLAGGLDSAGTGFVLGYIALKVLMVALYARAGVAEDDPETRVFCLACVVAYASSLVLWAASLAFDAPVRQVLWALGLAIEIGTPALGPSVFARMRVHLHHIPERFGLFTIIVIGETVVVSALGVDEWRTASALVAGAGLALVCGVWWLYFDRQEEIHLRPTIRPNLVFIYGHIPLLAALNAAAVGVEFGVEHAGSEPLELAERLILGGGVGATLLALTAVQAATLDGLPGREVALRVAGAGAAFAAGVAPLAPLVSMILIVAIVAALAVAGRLGAPAPQR
jgi:low temperature requirement protein LtrA